jgi:hypothetical protein
MFDFFKEKNPPKALLQQLPFRPISGAKQAMYFYEDAVAKRELRVRDTMPHEIPANMVTLFAACLIYQLGFLAVAISESKFRTLTVPITGSPIFQLLSERTCEYAAMMMNPPLSSEDFAAEIYKHFALPKLMFDNGTIPKRKFIGLCGFTSVTLVIEYFGLNSELSKDLLPPKRFRDVLDVQFEINRRRPYAAVIDRLDWATILSDPQNSGLMYYPKG